jgi:hypothetical protein
MAEIALKFRGLFSVFVYNVSRSINMLIQAGSTSFTSCKNVFTSYRNSLTSSRNIFISHQIQEQNISTGYTRSIHTNVTAYMNIPSSPPGKKNTQLHQLHKYLHYLHQAQEQLPKAA